MEAGRSPVTGEGNARFMQSVHPGKLELLYIVASCIGVLYCFGHERTTLSGLWILLSVLAGLLKPQAWAKSGPCICTECPYVTRSCQSQGVALGLLGPPTLMAAMMVNTSQGFWAMWFEASLAAALALAALLYWLSTTTAGTISPTATKSSKGQHACRAAAVVSVAVACSVLVIKPCSSIDSQTKTVQPSLCGIALVLPVVSAVPMYHALMSQLPRSFTLGEGLVVCQGMSLMVAAAAQLMLQQWHAHGHVSLLLGGMPDTTWGSKHIVHTVSAADGCCSNSTCYLASGQSEQQQQQQLGEFTLLLCFWVMALATCTWALLQGLTLLRSSWQQGSQQQQQKHAPDAATSLSGVAANSSSTCTSRLASVSCSTRCLLATAAAGLGLVVSVKALVELALWVLLDFLPARLHARLASLAYWATVMAASLPLMYRALHPKPVHAHRTRTSNGSTPAMQPHSTAAIAHASAGAVSVSGPNGLHKLRGRKSAVVHEAVHQAVAAPWSVPQPLVPLILLRKGYHLMAIALFVPVLLLDPAMMQVSLAIAFALMVFAEVLRSSHIPHVSSALQAFMSGFADDRDAGPLYLTHIALLLGIAVPVWLAHSCTTGFPAVYDVPAVHDVPAKSTMGAMGADGVELMGTCSSNASMLIRAAASGQQLAAAAAEVTPAAAQAHVGASSVVWLFVSASGLVCLGLGDTAASAVGFLYGRVKPFQGSPKTLEGTLAGAIAMLAGWLGLCIAWSWLGFQGQQGGHEGMLAELLRMRLQVVGLVGVTLGAALLEAVTHQLDNLVVPIYYAAHVLLCMSCTGAS